MQYRIAQFGLFGLATTVLGHQHHQNNKHSSFHDRRIQNHGPFGMGNATYPFPSGSGAVHTPVHTPAAVAGDATITQVKTATVKAVQAESVSTPVVEAAAVEAESVDTSDEDSEELCAVQTVTVTNPNKVTVTVTQPATSGVQGATSAPVVPVTPSSAAGVPSVPAASVPAASAPAASVPAASAPAGSAPVASVPAASSPAAVTSAPGAPGVPATQLTTSTVYSTQTTTDATGGVVTVTVPVSTTVCPVTATEGASTPAAGVPSASAPAGSAPVASVPAASAPAGSAPVASVPAASAPAGSAPVASVPAASAPAGSAPAASVPAASVPATSAPVAATTPAAGVPGVPATQLTTSTIYSTQTTTDATGGVVTVTVPVSTTVCPVTATEGASTPVAPVPTTDAAQITSAPAVSATQWTTSTIYSTQISTGADGGVTTITVPITTTVCPVTATEGAATPSSIAQTPVATPSSSAAAVTSAPASSVVSSSAVASATSTPSSSSGSAKRGLVYNTFSLISEFSASVSIGWMYNWAQTPGGTIPSTLEYVPQLWGLRTAYDTPDWKSNAEEQISLGSTHLMGYNEPDVEDGAGGSFLSATEAAEGWMTYMQPFAGKAKLVSPGVCNGEGVRPATGRNQGLDWLEDFVSACSSCTIDKINVHWYASYTGMGSDMETVVSYFKEYMEKAYKKFNKPLWVTEFELQGLDGVEGADEIEAKFIKEIDTYVASTAWIERYSYFKTETIVTKTALKTAYIS